MTTPRQTVAEELYHEADQLARLERITTEQAYMRLAISKATALRESEERVAEINKLAHKLKGVIAGWEEMNKEGRPFNIAGLTAFPLADAIAGLSSQNNVSLTSTKHSENDHA